MSENIKHVSFYPGNDWQVNDDKTSTISERTPKPPVCSKLKSNINKNQGTLISLCELAYSQNIKKNQDKLISLCEAYSQNAEHKSTINGDCIKLVIDENQKESFSNQLKNKNNQSKNPVKKITEPSHSHNKNNEKLMQSVLLPTTLLENRINRIRNNFGSLSAKDSDKINLHGNTKTMSDINFVTSNNNKSNDEKNAITELKKAGVLKINAGKRNLSDSQKNKSVGKVVDVIEVLKYLISACENTLQTLHFMDQHIADTDEYVEMALSNIRSLICWKSPMPASLINKYSSAKLFHKFMTGFYRMYFSNCFIKDKSAEFYHLHIDVVNQQTRLEIWLECYIPLLERLKSLAERFFEESDILYQSTLILLCEFKDYSQNTKHKSGISTVKMWDKWSGNIQSLQNKLFLDFEFADSHCKTDEFALEVINIVNAFIKDVRFQAEEIEK